MGEIRFFRFGWYIMVYLTFSESFETIEPIFQKILCEKVSKNSKFGNFLLKEEKIFFDWLITFHLLVQLPQIPLKILMLLLFYDVKLKNPDSLCLQAIFDHFWPFFDPRFSTPVFTR